MKKIFSLFLILLPALFLFSCSEKFDVAAPYQNISVVYGYLDKADTAHYIRIQKAFLSQDKSAITMAQTADSNFYSQINVSIKRLDFSGYLHDTIHLNRVDLTNEGYPKQSGTFFNAPNYAYKFKDVLDPNFIYRLIIRNLVTGAIDSAETAVIEDKDSSVFHVNIIDDTDQFSNKLEFSSTITGRSFHVFSSYICNGNFTYNNQTSPVSNGVVQLIIRFNWLDSNGSTTIKTPQSFDYNLGYLPISSAQIDFKVDNSATYKALASGMGKAPNNIYRIFSRCQLFMYLGTADYLTYEQIGLTQGTGLTANEIEPTYTNIKGANVKGLFTARGLRSGYVTVSQTTYDSLLASPLINPGCRMYWKNYQ